MDNEFCCNTFIKDCCSCDCVVTWIIELDDGVGAICDGAIGTGAIGRWLPAASVLVYAAIWIESWTIDGESEFHSRSDHYRCYTYL